MTELVTGQRFVNQFAHSTSAWLTIVALIALAVLIAAAAPRRPVLVGATGASLAVILGLTLVPTGGWRDFAIETGALHSIVTNLAPTRAMLTDWLLADDGPLNVLLFVPAGLMLSLLLRKPVSSTIFLTLMSVGIEAYQASLTTRVGSPSDIVANGLGAALGALVAGVALAVRRRPAHAVASPPRRRHSIGRDPSMR